MRVSVVIAYRNDPYIGKVVDNLLEGYNDEDFEIVLVDDASDVPVEFDFDYYTNLSIYRNKIQRGVGYSLDRGVSEARGDVIILMGADVMVKDPSWLYESVEYVKSHPSGIGCSVCLSGDPEHLNPTEPYNDVKRYGATVMPFATTEDLPSDSSMLDIDAYYVGMFESRWLKKKPAKEISEVPMVYGAFYVTNKEWYHYIGGWDTLGGNRLDGHQIWGALEAWISIKTWMMGGQCHVLTNIETLHIFHKHNPADPESYMPSGKMEWVYYNQIYLASIFMDEADRSNLLKKAYGMRVIHELPTLQFNMAKKFISNNLDHIGKVRDRVQQRATMSFNKFCDKFNIERRY